MRDDDLPELARLQAPAVGIDDLDDDVLGRNMQSAGRALVSDESGVAPAVSVRDAAA